jgi:hypothetical protein
LHPPCTCQNELMEAIPTRHAFRFTIGQGMAVIAALAVLFAFLPMPVAIGVAFLGLWLLVPRRKNVSNPALVRTIGCLCSLLGFFLGAAIGVVTLPFPPNPGLAVTSVLSSYGFIGAIVAGVIGHQVASRRFGRPPSSRDPSSAKRKAVQDEIELVGRLLVLAEEEGDEDVSLKLAAYRARLEQELRHRTG